MEVQWIAIKGERLCLTPHRAIWWARTHTLIVADMHIDKPAHFRKAGIPISKQSMEADLERLSAAIRFFSPKRLLVLGDVFHSNPNTETKAFSHWVAQQSIEVELISGNHDQLALKHLPPIFSRVSALHRESIFCFAHAPEDAPPDAFTLCGHWHPQIQLQGKGKQRLTLPCFYFTPTLGVLPAFGSFTGGYTVSLQANTEAYPITPNKVFPKVKHPF